MSHKSLGLRRFSSLLGVLTLGIKTYLAKSYQIHQKVKILFILALFLNGQKLIDLPRTFLALGQKQSSVQNSGLDLKKKKKINIQECSGLQKWKKTDKRRFENKLTFLYLFKS